MDSLIPKCPRCPAGGSVRLVSEDKSESALAPLPGHTRTAELFQCKCGWTMVRTKPPARKPDDDTQ